MSEPIQKMIEASELRRRLIKSLIAGGFFALFVISTFIYVRTQEKDKGIPRVLRAGHSFQAAVAEGLHSNTRQSVSLPKPEAGKNPRVNGMIGLQEPAAFDEDYRVIVESGDQRLELKVDELRAQPAIEVSTLFKCIEGWSEIVHYKGLSFKTFLDLYKVGRKPDGSFYRFVGMETPDGKYYVSIDMESMLHEQSVLAYQMNEDELSEPNGYPIRLIIPIKYGIKSIKRIGRIFFSDQKPPDYWNERGYDWFAGL